MRQLLWLQPGDPDPVSVWSQSFGGLRVALVRVATIGALVQTEELVVADHGAEIGFETGEVLSVTWKIDGDREGLELVAGELENNVVIPNEWVTLEPLVYDPWSQLMGARLIAIEPVWTAWDESSGVAWCWELLLVFDSLSLRIRLADIEGDDLVPSADSVLLSLA